AVRLSEAVEDVREKIGAKAGGGIGNRQPSPLGVGLEAYRDVAARRSELDRVGEQIAGDLLESPGVPRYHQRSVQQDRSQMKARRFDGRSRGLERHLHDADQMERVHVER